MNPREAERGPTAHPGYREERDAWAQEAKKLKAKRKAKKRAKFKWRAEPQPE